METETNLIKKYGKPFQDKCLAILMSDRAFIEQISDILSADYFETEQSKWMVNFLLDYFPKYSNLPTANVYAVELQKLEDPVLQASIKEQVKTAYKQISTSDTEYIKSEFLQFCKQRKLANAILESYDLLKRGEYDKILSLVNDASKAGMERNFGHDYFNDVEARLSELAREVVRTNWTLIDKHLDGGLGKGELGFVVGSAGSGKSWNLIRIGAEALKQGKNVMHFTMELGEKYVGRRYDAYFSKISFQDVSNHKDAIKKRLDAVENKGKLFIKYFPMLTPTAQSIKLFIEKFQMANNVKIDLIIVDYADLLKTLNTRKNGNSYEDGGNIYGELRSIAGELQVPLWTASQAHRASHEEEVIGATGVADSYKKIMIGDFIMSLSRKTEDKLAGTARFHIIKSRFSGDGSTYYSTFNASNGSIEIYDKDSIEGKEIIQKIQEHEKNVKNIIKKAASKAWGDEDDK